MDDPLSALAEPPMITVDHRPLYVAQLAPALEALTSQAGILDQHLKILAVNGAWKTFAVEHDLGGPTQGVDLDYLSYFHADAARDGTVEAGLHALLAGESAPFQHSYVMAASGSETWIELRAVQVKSANRPYIIITHHDVSAERRSQTALLETTARLLRAEDDERRRIAREMHDSTAQYLIGAKLTLTPRATRGLEDQRTAAEQATNLIDVALTEIRTLAYQLHPPELDHLGLAAAIRSYAAGYSARTGIAIKLNAPKGFPRLSDENELALYRIAQEALANVHGHSGSKRARIDLCQDGEVVRLTIRDYGSGRSEAGAIQAGVGLGGMKLRLSHLAGGLSLSNVSPGFQVEAWLPLVAREAATDTLYRHRRWTPGREGLDADPSGHGGQPSAGGLSRVLASQLQSFL